MKKLLITIVLILSLAAAGIGIGCASLSEYLTPATRNDRAVNYVVDSGVADVNDYSGYFNLEKALRLSVDVTAAKEVKDLAIKQMHEENQLLYNQLNAVVTHNLELAQAREEYLFDPQSGLLSMGLTAAGLGTFTGLLGLFRKRPGDLTPQDVEKATVGLRNQVGMKDSQFAQVVTGVEKFMKHKDQLVPILQDSTKPPMEKVDALLAVLKTYLGKEQDQTTRQEVAKVKATV